MVSFDLGSTGSPKSKQQQQPSGSIPTPTSSTSPTNTPHAKDYSMQPASQPPHKPTTPTPTAAASPSTPSLSVTPALSLPSGVGLGVAAGLDEAAMRKAVGSPARRASAADGSIEAFAAMASAAAANAGASASGSLDPSAAALMSNPAAASTGGSGSGSADSQSQQSQQQQRAFRSRAASTPNHHYTGHPGQSDSPPPGFGPVPSAGSHNPYGQQHQQQHHNPTGHQHHHQQHQHQQQHFYNGNSNRHDYHHHHHQPYHPHEAGAGISRSLTGSPTGRPTWSGAQHHAGGSSSAHHSHHHTPSGQWSSGASSSGAGHSSIWNNTGSQGTGANMSSLSAEKAFLEADLPTRQYRSFSFALPSSLKDPAEVDPAHARAMAAFRARAADMSLREAPETGDMTEEEYNGIPKGRSRSKSSSAIYGLPGDSFDGSDDPVAAAVAAANLAMQSGPGSQMPDMSALWRDANRPQESYHRRASTQPNHQTLMWEALRSSHLATANDMNGVYTEELLDRYRQQHAAQMRRFSVAPSVLNRYINNNVDHSPDMVGMGGTPAGYDMGRRRHSLAGTTFDRKINTRDVAEGLEAMGLNDQLSQIDDYFDNTENRVRAWSEAGKNLQMNNHTSALSPVALMSPAVHYTLKFPLYVVEFKAGRTDFFFLADDSLGPLSLGDLVIVEADRGKDLGKIIENNINSPQELQLYQATHTDALIDTHIGNKEVQPKRIFRLSAPQEIAMLLGKSQDEAKAMGVCQVKIRQKKLPMEIVDAEYQWDRRKLTFYFVAERRVDFRELVRELFKIYKTRIWMCAVSSKTPGLESAPQSPQLYENDPPAE